MSSKKKSPVPPPLPGRSYGQFCPLARTLDLVGERWTLLIVRNLAAGPQRYKELLEGLPGIGTNLLAARLRVLEQHGVVRRRKLPPPAGSTAYELGERGEELFEALLPLMRWGLPTLRWPARKPEFSMTWVAVGFRALFRPEAAAGVSETFEFRIGVETVHLRVKHGKLSAHIGPSEEPDVVLRAEPRAFMEIAAGSLSPLDALAGGRLTVDGGDDNLARFLRLFDLPNPPDES